MISLTRKTARIVGEVMGKFHPHGDTAIYDALVRMAQDFSMRVPLIEGQGNFGSIDGDMPAAMRYTEARLAKVSAYMLDDIEKDTVHFKDNYDGSEKEPDILPARFPNLLVNGSGGIAVGMATNIPPHNLGEVIDATCAYVKNNDITDLEIMDHIKGPDFPTGGIIMGRSGIHSAITTGKGSVIIRGKTHFEDMGGRKTAIIITEVPYQVNKARMIEKIADLVKDKKLEGISDLRDESDRRGIRVVIELKKDIQPDIVLNNLFLQTPLQTSFGVNMLALDKVTPKQMSTKDVISIFVDFRKSVIIKRTHYLLNQVKAKVHLLIGLSVAVANIDEIITIIKSSKDTSEAKIALMNRTWKIKIAFPVLDLIEEEKLSIEGKDQYQFSENQAKAILDMKLSKLTGLENQKILDEIEVLTASIREYLKILNEEQYLLSVLVEEMIEVKEKFATPRLTQIEDSYIDHDIEDLIPKEDMVITITMNGYVKRVPLSTYRSQHRGGKGKSGMNVRNEDMTTDVIITNTHSQLLFFSSKGMVYTLKVYKLPMGSAQSMGRAFVNLLPLDRDEKVNNILPVDSGADFQNINIIFATAKGNIRRNLLSDFERIQSNGKIAIKLDEDDSLVGVRIADTSDNIFLASKSGKALRCPVEAVRIFKGRSSDGVRGMKLSKDDQVISMCILSGHEYTPEQREIYLGLPNRIKNNPDKVTADHNISADLVRQMKEEEQYILTITENGYGKRTSTYEYRVAGRGGQGISNIVTSKRNGNVVVSFPTVDQGHILLITSNGTVIRIRASDIRVIGRNTQGVSLFRIEDGQQVVAAARVNKDDVEDDEDDDESNDASNTANDNEGVTDSD